MLSGRDGEVIGVWVEGCELLCRGCAVKRLGDARAQRVMAWLSHPDEWGAPEAAMQYAVDEEALDRGDECDCERALPSGTHCSSCGVAACDDCGVRMDRLQAVAP